MKQSEVGLILATVKDDYRGNNHINKVKAQAITEAIKAVELLPELVEALEEQVKSWSENITDEDSELFIARHAEILKKAKGEA